jgi:hypothetical protein
MKITDKITDKTRPADVFRSSFKAETKIRVKTIPYLPGNAGGHDGAKQKWADA